MDYEAKAREVASDYDLHCETIDEQDIGKLTQLIAAALKQAVEQEQFEIEIEIAARFASREPSVFAWSEPLKVVFETIRGRRRELPHLASCKIEGEFA